VRRNNSDDSDDDDSSYGSLPPLVSRGELDDESSCSSCESMPPLMRQYDTDSNDDDESVWSFELDELDAGTGRELAIPSVELAGISNTDELAALKMEGKSAKIGPHTYLADSGASSHMGPGDAGMFDLIDESTTVKVGNGKHLPVAKVGKKKGTIKQADGSEVQVTLKRYKQVPDLWVNLFSVTAAMADGWHLGS
jgi:hypothetical protein